MVEDSGGCICTDQGGGIADRQKNIKVIEREGSGVLCNAGLSLLSGNDVTDRETTTEVAGLLEQLHQEYCRSEDGG